MLALLAPGQGSQAPGMLSPWLDLADTAEVISRFSEITGLDLLRLGTTADADEIKDTAITQPLLVSMGLIAAANLAVGDSASDPRSAAHTLVAGHSVGELTAAAVAGALTDADAVALAARRGAEMAAACALAPTGMAAVLGGDADEVVAAIEQLGLTAANRNGAGQIVAAGDLDALARLQAEPPTKARVRPLAVAGAFHTDYMAPAGAALGEFADTIAFQDPRLALLSNADGTAVGDGAELRRRLVNQVTRPVRWDLCLRTMGTMGVDAVIELAPGGVLAGLVKRELNSADTPVRIVAVKNPDDLEAARALITSTATEGASS